ncbi:hypothetical protein BS78_04G304300 [Paspalum vaginatum]|nr:hypothetical protein BS78_04G304300 [Paspalum vaginatum]
MPRASRVSNPPAAAAAAAKNVSSSFGHSSPSSSAPACQSFRPVTRSMTRVSDPIVASPVLKEGGSVSTSTRRSISDASFNIQSAASRPTATHARTPQKNSLSGWKPLSQPVALSEERKCASLTINPTAKRSRVASSRSVKDSKPNSNVPSGKKCRDEENMSLGDQLDGAVMQSPTKKLLTCKGPSDSPSIRKPTIKTLGGKGAALPPMGKSQIEAGKNFASLPAKTISATTNDISQSADAAVPLSAQQLQSDTAKNSSFITEAAANEPSQVNRLAATVVTLPMQNLQTDCDKKPPSVPIMTYQASGLAGASAPLITPKLEIGSVKDTSNRLSGHAYTRALLIKQQEQLLQQYKLGGSQLKQQQLYIKGPALFENDDAPPVEPLGARCQLCKLDVAFRPQGDAGRDANAPPVVAVLSCQHAFHSSCIESVYGLAEPAECLACLEPGQRTGTSI